MAPTVTFVANCINVVTIGISWYEQKAQSHCNSFRQKGAKNDRTYLTLLQMNQILTKKPEGELSEAFEPVVFGNFWVWKSTVSEQKFDVFAIPIFQEKHIAKKIEDFNKKVIWTPPHQLNL